MNGAFHEVYIHYCSFVKMCLRLLECTKKKGIHTLSPISLLWRACPFNWSSVKMSFRHWETVCTALRWRYCICYHRCNLQITPETREASSVELSKEDRKNVSIFFGSGSFGHAWFRRDGREADKQTERGYFSLCFSCNKTVCLLHSNSMLFLLLISCVLWGCCCCVCRVLLWLCGGGLWREDVHCSGHPPCRHRRATGKAGTGHQSAGQGAAHPGRNTDSQSPAAVQKTAVTYWWISVLPIKCILTPSHKEDPPYFLCVQDNKVSIFRFRPFVRQHTTFEVFTLGFFAILWHFHIQTIKHFIN